MQRLDEFKRSRIDKWKKLLEFSVEMEDVFGFKTHSELVECATNGIQIELKNYFVSAKKRHTGYEWVYVLEARPKWMPAGHGFVDIAGNQIAKMPDPFNWQYEPNGTATYLCPSENIQRDILREIKEKIANG